MRFKAKNGAIREYIAPIRANQITGTTSDFKMGVINIYIYIYIYTYFYFTEKPSLGLSREFKLYFSKIFQDYLNIAL